MSLGHGVGVGGPGWGGVRPRPRLIGLLHERGEPRFRFLNFTRAVVLLFFGVEFLQFDQPLGPNQRNYHAVLVGGQMGIWICLS